ncbi:MAG: hypothetical protein HY903_05175 [Deltaproteobacteria bacterium]|nr:hypothetical protein [Deltaproteobacteria bacterium]
MRCLSPSAVLLLAGCAVPFQRGGRPPLPDPVAHELFLLAFADQPPRHLVLERTLGRAPRLDLFVVDSERHTRTSPALEAELPAATLLTPALGVEDAIRAIQSSPVANAITALGFAWPEVATTPTLTTAHGDLYEQDGELRLAAADAELPVALFAAGVPVLERVWLVARDRRQVALSIAYDSAPAARDLRVVTLTRMEAQVLSLRAARAHADASYELALALWYQAQSLTPEDADLSYNLACAHARLGHPDTALNYLAHAVALGGDHLKAWARRDPDLELIRPDPRFLAIAKRRRPPDPTPTAP